MSKVAAAARPVNEGERASSISGSLHTNSTRSRWARKLGKASGVQTKELFKLFPKGPAKLAAMVAGIPKPKGCI